MKKLLLILLSLSLVLLCFSCGGTDGKGKTTDETTLAPGVGDEDTPDVTTSGDVILAPDTSTTSEERERAYGMLLSSWLSALSGDVISLEYTVNYGAIGSPAYSADYSYSELQSVSFLLSSGEKLQFKMSTATGSSTSEDTSSDEYIYKDGWLYRATGDGKDITLKKTAVSAEELGFVPGEGTAIDPGAITALLSVLGGITLFSTIETEGSEEGTRLTFSGVDSAAINSLIVSLLESADEEEMSDAAMLELIKMAINSGIAAYDVRLSALINAENKLLDLDISFAVKTGNLTVMGADISYKFDSPDNIQIDAPENSDEYTEYPYEDFFGDIIGAEEPELSHLRRE